MMKHNYSFAKKATAVFLSAVIFAAMLAGMFGILYMAESNYYSSTLTQVQKADQTQMLVDKIERVRYLFLVEGMDPAEYFENTNFEFTIIDGNGYKMCIRDRAYLSDRYGFGLYFQNELGAGSLDLFRNKLKNTFSF